MASWGGTTYLQVLQPNLRGFKQNAIANQNHGNAKEVCPRNKPKKDPCSRGLNCIEVAAFLEFWHHT
jgi:hypothetical protein